MNMQISPSSTHQLTDSLGQLTEVNAAQRYFSLQCRSDT